MKKLISLILCVVLILFCAVGCSGNVDADKSTEPTKSAIIEKLSKESIIKLDEDKADEVYSLLSTGEGMRNDIRNFYYNINACFDEELPYKEVTAEFEGKKSKYAYSILQYDNIYLVLIFDIYKDYPSEVCGCLCFADSIDTDELLKAKTFSDVQSLDPSLNFDSLAFEFNCMSSSFLLNRSDEDFLPIKSLKPNTYHTLQCAADGLYVVSYDGDFGDGSNPNVSSVNLVKSDIYNSVYKALS